MSSLPVVEFNSLFAIYNSTDGDNWAYSYGNPWNFSEPDPDPCGEHWQGVYCEKLCNATACHDVVTELDFIQVNLDGTLPAEIGDFSSLTVLYIYFNGDLRGTLPATIGNLSALQSLLIFYTSISGTIPSSIGKLHSLESIEISDSYLSGSLPEELFQLSNLTVLDLQSNILDGTISNSIENLHSLRTLSVGYNLFDGNIPASIVNLPVLNMAIWDRNSFHGTIPNGWLSSNRSLYTLSVYENLLTGPLPTEWYEGKNISNLDFYLNLLEGEIPLQFYQLKGLSHLAVGRNAFSGSISRQIGNLSELAVFEAAHNCLTGTIPSSLGQLRIFFDLDIGHNYLTGTIPREIVSMSQLEYLSVSNAYLTGTIPTGFGNSNGYFIDLDVGSNLLTGTIPEDIFMRSAWQGLVVDFNMLTGTVSESFGQMSGLFHLVLNNNLFHGRIPLAISNLTYLDNLSLGSNLFTGSFEVSLVNMTFLDMLQLQCNRFTGSLDFIPAPGLIFISFFNVTQNYFEGSMNRVSYLSQAVVLDFSNNLFSGTLPSISSMSSLYYFFAQSNILDGPIESWLRDVVSEFLQIVDVSSNQLTGRLPGEFTVGTPNNISFFAAVQNCFSGTIPESLCNLTHLQVLALDGLSTAKSCRQSILPFLPQIHSYSLNLDAIHGKIPKCLFSMPKLRTLHLAGNGLTGSIPVTEDSDLGPRLNDLSLSHNFLTGSLPQPLRGGSRWLQLDVSYNKLKGELQLNDDASNSSTTSTGFSSDASIYLNINRLSGRIPSFYYDVGLVDPGDLNMLRGSMFSCPSSALRSDVPTADPYNRQYGCGSDALNIALLIWTGLVIAVIVAVVLLFFNNKHEKKRLDSHLAENQNQMIPQNETLLHYFYHQLKHWWDSLIFWQQFDWDQIITPSHSNQTSSMLERKGLWKEIWHEIVNTTSSSNGTFNYREGLLDIVLDGRLLHQIRYFVFYMVTTIICIGSPIFGCLTAFYGSYSHEYVWTLSAAYLSGKVSVSLLLVLFTILVIVAIGTAGRSLCEAPIRLNGNNDKRGDIDNKLEAVNDSNEVGISPVDSFDETNRLPYLESDNQQIVDLPDSDRSMEDIDKTKSSDPADVKLERWKVLAMKIGVAIVNIGLVSIVNGLYVYLYLQIPKWSAMMLSVALSIFKVCWSMMMQQGVVRFLQPLQHLSTNDLHQENMRFVSSLMLFNTIVAPCLATMFASSDCFFFVFSSPSTIKSSYPFQQCAQFADLGCEEVVIAEYSIEFAPPFNYTYQCSSALLIEYAYVFVYKYVLIGILYPLSVMIIVLYGDWKRTRRMKCDGESHSSSSRLLRLEKILPLLWRVEEQIELQMTVKENESIVSPLAINPIIKDTMSSNAFSANRSSNLSPSPSVGQRFVCFSSGDYVIRLTMMLGCLLTFGSVLPYLSVLIGLSIISNTYLTQIGWLRVLECAFIGERDDEKEKKAWKTVLLELGEQCGKMRAGLIRAGQPLLVLIPFFYACYVFDTAGDQGGGWEGLYFVLAWIGILIVVVLLLFYWLWRVKVVERSRQSSHDKVIEQERCGQVELAVAGHVVI
eukprot:scaffold1463_cov189-Ochromonas_danica.AAC.19